MGYLEAMHTADYVVVQLGVMFALGTAVGALRRTLRADRQRRRASTHQ